MWRFLRTLVAVLACAAATAAASMIALSRDPTYTFHEWLHAGQFHAHDGLIEEVSRKHGVDARLVKAMVWRESKFDPRKVGLSGERGLMQVGELAAQDWAKAEKVSTFMPTDLFEPRTNIEVGVWYLRQALDRWRERDDPVPFALAEYNAGRSRVDRWIAATQRGEAARAEDLMASMDFPTTRKYIQTIAERRRFYEVRGRM